MSILERIERWHTRAQLKGKALTRILVHPADAAEAPANFMGLPIEVFGYRNDQSSPRARQ